MEFARFLLWGARDWVARGRLLREGRPQTSLVVTKRTGKKVIPASLESRRSVYLVLPSRRATRFVAIEESVNARELNSALGAGDEADPLIDLD